MKRSRTTRREFVVGAGLAAGAGSLTLLGCPPSGGGSAGGSAGVAEVPPAGGLGIRHDVTSADAAAQVDAYRAAVAAMKARPANDPTSWRAQAEIHDNFCPHGNAFFLPWHRAYLSYFERICRTAANDPDFALPYWDWSTQGTIPDRFWSGTLNDTTRQIPRDRAIPPRVVGPEVIDPILDIADFETFGSGYVDAACSSGTACQRTGVAYGALEGGPHNQVHGRIGGNMASYLSPLDPIFWLHHCNIDRLWMEWNKTHANGGDAAWRAFTFAANFVDPAGAAQSLTVEETFSTLDFDYRFDTQPATDLQTDPPATDGEVAARVVAENTATAALGETLHIPVALSPEVIERMAARRADATEPVGGSTVRLTISGARNPSRPVAVELYVGAAASPESADDPSFVRSFGFFPTEGDHLEHGGTDVFYFDIGRDLDRLGDAWDPASGTLPVHLRTEPLMAAAETLEAAVTPSSVAVEIVEVR